MSMVTTRSVRSPGKNLRLASASSGGPINPTFGRKFRLIAGDSQNSRIIPKPKSRIKKINGNVIHVSFSNKEKVEGPSRKTQEGQKTNPSKTKVASPTVSPNKSKAASPKSQISPKEKIKGEPVFQTSFKVGLEMKNTVASSKSQQKGYNHKRQGKFDQLWMVKWFDWYKYVVAMTRKAWDIPQNVSGKLLSANVRAESAKTAHSG